MKPDNGTFPALNLAIQALKIGGSAPAILNAANEIAVGAFLENKIPFLSITKIVDLTINKSNICEITSIEEVLDVDIQARETAENFIRLEI